MAWCPMNKSALNLYRNCEIALAGIERDLNASSVVENPGRLIARSKKSPSP